MTDTVFDTLWDFLDKRREDADHAIAASALSWIDNKYRNSSKQEEWKLIKDIPEDLESCVVLYGKDSGGELRLGIPYTCSTAYYANDMREYPEHNIHKYTHWMPLPKPPEGL